MPNGMKSGSGDDPFADVDEEATGTKSTDGSDQEEDKTLPQEDAEEEESEIDNVSSEPNVVIPAHPADKESSLPWIHRRNGVKDNRTHKTLHYTEHTIKRERRVFLSMVEAELGEDVELTDAREAAYLVGMSHVEEVAEQLREWGYAME